MASPGGATLDTVPETINNIHSFTDSVLSQRINNECFKNAHWIQRLEFMFFKKVLSPYQICGKSMEFNFAGLIKCIEEH